MKIKKNTMQTNEGRFEYVAQKKSDIGCEKCVFLANKDCNQIPCAHCDGGYWVKKEDKPVTNGDRYKEDE